MGGGAEGLKENQDSWQLRSRISARVHYCQTKIKKETYNKKKKGNLGQETAHIFHKEKVLWFYYYSALLWSLTLHYLQHTPPHSERKQNLQWIYSLSSRKLAESRNWSPAQQPDIDGISVPSLSLVLLITE